MSLSNRLIVAALFLFLIVSFLTLHRNPLLNDDAALYALAAKNAIVHHQWLAQFVTPGDIKSFIDKPPLGLWLLAWLPQLTGINELTIHIPNVLYYSLLLLLMYLLLPKKLALSATIIAATSLALVVYSRTPKLDVLLTLFTFASLISLYNFLQTNKSPWLYLFTLGLAGGFLVKSGFGLFIPGLTVFGLLLYLPEARQKLLKALFSRQAIYFLSLLLLIVGGILALQALELKGEWLNYLKSFTIQSKYNISYLGFGFHTSIIGLLLITIFPWTPLFIADCFKIARRLDLRTFCLIWFWANFIFLFFFYNQTDFRTMTVFVPPLAILASDKLNEIKSRNIPLILWNLFFLFIFSSAFILLWQKPYNPDGFYLGDALWPLALFVLTLLWLTNFYFRPKLSTLIFSSLLLFTAYSALFYCTLPIANAFNPDHQWPALIKKESAFGREFYIYRPRDRQLFFSPDLFYVDFMAGPATQYFWDGNELKKALKLKKAVVLSDTESWNKLGLKGNIIGKDNYSLLLLTQ